MVIPALKEKNLAKILEENDKKIVENPCQVEERRKVKNFLKGCFWNSQGTVLKKLKYDLRLIEK